MNLSLMKIEFADKPSAAKLLTRLSAELYDPLTGVGFKDLDLESSGYVSGYAAKRRPIFVKVFDVNEGKVVEREEFLLSESFFRLDLENGMAEIYAGPRDAKYAADVFVETVDNDVRLTPSSESVASLLQAMRSSRDSYEITALDISEFVAERGVIGNYSIRTIDAAKGWNFLDKYGPQIKGATVSRVDIGLQAVIHLLGSGRFRFSVRPKSSVSELASSIKSLVVETGRR